jgi:hypothetical protein
MPVTPRVLARRRSESAVSEGMPERERKGVRAAPGVAWLGVADGAREPCTNAHGVGARQLHLCHDRTMRHVAAAESAAAVVSWQLSLTAVKPGCLPELASTHLSRCAVQQGLPARAGRGCCAAGRSPGVERRVGARHSSRSSRATAQTMSRGCSTRFGYHFGLLNSLSVVGSCGPQ